MPADIAIVGIAVELPSGEYSDKNLDHETFFDFLLNKGQAYERLPKDRFDIDSWYGHGPGQIHVQHGAFLKDIDAFDNVEFGISNKDARAMAPATRKLIEISFLALLDSGIDYRSKNIGCYTAGTSHDILNVTEPDVYDTQGSFAGVPSMIANRVSYHLDLLGPSVPTDTACSSTLTALHLAVQALLQDECEAAVVAGCQLNYRFIDWVMYSQGSVLAKDGKCKPFDESADGFSRGEGAVAIVVKPLRAAVKDNDYIYATILGTAINATGSSGPPGAPVAAAQLKAMQRAFKLAGRTPQEVAYVECHATGTSRGDPEEINWVGQHFYRENGLIVGSTKGNIGHTEITAFLASLSKVISILKREVIPPNVNLITPNSAIKWDEYKLYAPMEPVSLPGKFGQKRLISMASSGIGGSNGHIVLESPPNAKFEGSESKGPILLIASGLSSRSVTTIAENLANVASNTPDILSDLAIDLGRLSRQMSWHSFAIVDPKKSKRLEFTAPVVAPRTKRPIAFVFSGQGPQHKDMGRQFFELFPAFRNSILESDDVYRKVTGKSLVNDYGLFGTSRGIIDSIPEPWPIALVLPSIAIFQIALYDLFLALGVKPDIVLGHSAGETAVLYASGSGSRAMAVELSIARGETLTSIESLGGTMAALSCGFDDANRILADAKYSDIEVACCNSPNAVAISGKTESIDHVLGTARSMGIFGTKLKTRVPFHSSLMEVCRDDYCSAVAKLFDRYSTTHRPHTATYSTLTGDLFTASFDAAYYWNNTRSKVLFKKAIESIVDRDVSTLFVEIAPHPVLSPYIGTMTGAMDLAQYPVSRPKKGHLDNDYHNLLKMLGKLIAAGYTSIDFIVLNGRKGSNSARSLLPPYPFVRKRFPLYPNTDGYRKQIRTQYGPLNSEFLVLNKYTHKLLAQHIVGGEPIMPAAGLLEMAFEFGATSLFNVAFKSFLSLSPEHPTRVDVNLSGFHWSINSNRSSSPISNEGKTKPRASTVHAEGYLSFDKIADNSSRIDLSAIRNRCRFHADSNTFYSSLTGHLEYGPVFQRVTSVYYSLYEALMSINGTDEELFQDGKYILHPAILDSSFHITVFRPFIGDYNKNAYYLPHRVGTISLHERAKISYFPAHTYAYCKLKNWTPSHVQYDIIFIDDNGSRLCTLESFEVLKHYIYPQSILTRPLKLTHEVMASPLVTLGQSRIRQNGHSAVSYKKVSSLTFEFKVGAEIDLQNYLRSASVAFNEIKLWILAREGLDGNAAIGFVRALSREFLSQNFHLVIFPIAFDDLKRRQILENLPDHLLDELELYVTAEGEVAIPRIATLPDLDKMMYISPAQPSFLAREGYALVRVSKYLVEGDIISFLGVIVSGKHENVSEGSTVAGLSNDKTDEDIIEVDINALSILNTDRVPGCVPSLIAGFVVGVFAAPSQTFRRIALMQCKKILLTHCNTSIGAGVSHLYTARAISILQVSSDISLLDLSRLGYNSFDIIISGYEDVSFIDILKSLLHPVKGRVYLWNSSDNGLATIISRDPWMIGDALRDSTSFVVDKCQGSNLCSASFLRPAQKSFKPSIVHARFDPTKSYLLLGGIGSLGVHVALWMYERGARHLVLTSRSGDGGLLKGGNVLSKRIVSFLEGCTDLELNLKKCDATNLLDMSELITSINPRLGGCFILTRASNDRSFLQLSQDDFTRTHASKIGVFNVFKSVIDIAMLDFFVVFSSTSGLFGNGGQTTYGSAITALDGLITGYKNAFSFICPPIIGTNMMWDSEANKTSSSVSHLVEWAMSSEELLQWLDDSISRFQRGESFSTYVPNLDWDVVHRNHPLPKFCQYLLSATVVDVKDNTFNESESLIDIVLRHLDVPRQDFSFQVPFVSYGLDSLSASNLSFAIRNIITLSQLQLLSSQMTLEYLQSQITKSSKNIVATEDSKRDQTVLNEMQMVLKDFEQELLAFEKPSERNTRVAKPRAVLLTGSTGSLGPNILSHLIDCPEIDIIYVLYRTRSGVTDGRDKQAGAFIKQGLSSEYAKSQKIVYIECDFSAACLNIARGTLDKILLSVNYIIHNAWSADFYSPFSAFRELVHGTSELLKIALRSKVPNYPHFLFISTTGVCRTTSQHVNVREDYVSDMKLLERSGYIQSKWVAEQMMRCARMERSLQTTIVRVGQLTSSINGAWNTNEWFPSMVKSALYVNCLPNGDDMVHWLPIDIAAAIIVELLETTDSVVHMSHPRPVKWNAIIKHVADNLSIPLIPYPEWFRRVESDFRSSSSRSGDNPARKLIDFFRKGLVSSEDVPSTESMHLLAKVDMKNGQKSSILLRNENIPQLGPKDVDKWLHYWRSINFL